ncbi:MAG: 4Fe-4S binding protein [Armatimonadota bacterium]
MPKFDRIEYAQAQPAASGSRQIGGSARLVINIRRASQIAFLLLFTVLFVMATNRLAGRAPVPVDLFLRADPLVFLMTGISTSAASSKLAFAAAMVIPVLVVVVVTVLLGRVFCGWVCPLGTIIDISDRILYRRGRPFQRPRRQETRRWRNWKYLFLIASLVAAVFSTQIAFLLDPISLATRTFAFTLMAPAAYLWNLLLHGADKIGIQGFVYDRFEVNIGAWRLLPYSFRQNLVVMAMFAGIIALGYVQERFWCRNLCPLGALLGLLSRVCFLRHYISDKCNHCTLCERESRMGAYEHMSAKDEEDETHNPSECIQCFRCAVQCRPSALSIRLGLPLRKRKPGGPAPQPALDIGRRRVLASGAAGALWMFTAKTNARAHPDASRALRPPGALPEKEFLAACTRCGECMRACITNGLQPALLETGLEGIWTPILVPKIGPCAEKCTACGQVCPTDAIRPFTIEDKKKRLKLGLANVDKNLCIAWNEGKDCIVCAEVCAYQAVIFKDVYDPVLQKKKRVPTVDTKLCTGCGLCEHHCPVVPNRAIIVYTVGEDRDF